MLAHTASEMMADFQIRASWDAGKTWHRIYRGDETILAAACQPLIDRINELESNRLPLYDLLTIKEALERRLEDTPSANHQTELRELLAKFADPSGVMAMAGNSETK